MRYKRSVKSDRFHMRLINMVEVKTIRCALIPPQNLSYTVTAAWISPGRGGKTRRFLSEAVCFSTPAVFKIHHCRESPPLSDCSSICNLEIPFLLFFFSALLFTSLIERGLCSLPSLGYLCLSSSSSSSSFNLLLPLSDDLNQPLKLLV